MYQSFYLPTKIISGWGSLQELPGEALKWGGRALVVTDPGIRSAGLLEKVEAVLAAGGVACTVYADVQANPTIQNAEDAAKLARESGAQLLIAVGGGSSIDTAKSAAVLLNNGGSLADYVGFDRFANQPAPVIAIPTTAGTGSEVTLVAVMADPASHRKFTVGSTRMMPKVALLDAELTMGLPAMVTAYTGMDALTHAIESYTSITTQPLTDAVNLSTITSIFEHLPTAALRGDNKQAREAMLYSSCMASMTCNSTFLGLVHAIASPVCAVCGAAHGMACAVLLPAVMDYNLPVAQKKYAKIALAIGAADRSESERDQAEKAIGAVRRLSEEIGIPRRLGQIGVKEEQLDQIAGAAWNYPQALSNCRRAAKADVEALLRAIL
ncbi:iron-containing alcohol dehydrogenase [Oscillibacter sp. MSJ-2]|uniref:Iron-containing alcohol dehydrogenase n=1 Tax=Dysosmobacter acutus TaxID=2841504 RepID=A0ABS6F9K6_9FIRM|nr:iron-containing alcohol dehydrogenase [Dysosmobacter acutus]MBU5626750.1 iron-containing alcohol dehydrogenase [Dysosmobacter acutus]